MFLIDSYRGNPMSEIAIQATEGLGAIREVVDLKNRQALYWCRVDEFPLTGSRKIQKLKLRDEYSAPRDDLRRHRPPFPGRKVASSLANTPLSGAPSLQPRPDRAGALAYFAALPAPAMAPPAEMTESACFP